MGRLWRFVVCAVLAMLVAAGMPAAAWAEQPAHPGRDAGHGLPILPPGDGAWSRSAAPENTTVDWSPRPGNEPNRAVPTDPNAKVVEEIPDRRTANSSVYRLSDGREQEVVSAAPVHYRDAKGSWQPLDTQVKPLSHNGFSFGVEGNAFQTYFSADAGSLLRVERGTSFLQLAADGAKTGQPAVSGDTATYPGALDGADLSYQVGAGAVKERIVLNRAPAAAPSYSFTLSVRDLVPTQRPDGSIAFAGTEAPSRPVFVLPAPFMTDSTADADSPYGTAYSTKVAQTMSWDAKAGTVRITERPDQAWLAAKERTYPVTVDPTIAVSPAPSDAANVMILQDSPTTNYDTSWRMSVGTTGTGAARGLIKFPMPSVPAGTTITSASMNLYYDQYFTTGTTNVPVEAHAATAAWDPTTATWNSANGITGALAGSTTKQAGVRGVWNSFPVTSTVQGWLNGSPNYGFVVKAQNESPLGQGGPRYEASIYGYSGETANYPQLVITYGVPGVTVNAPTVIHSTGAELSWPTYANNTGNSANNLVEYQVHRSIYQTFTPSASTEVAPVAAGTNNFVDSTAQPTPTSSTDPYGNAYYYMVAVKTASGAVIPGPTSLVRLPKAGLTTVLIRQGAATTLSSAQPTTVLNTLTDSGLQQPWLEVGNNSSTYGKARAVVNFGALPSTIPANATVTEAHLKLWQFETTTGTTGANYELHALTRAPTINQATWNNANSTTPWTTAGGDVNPTADGTLSGFTNDPNRRNFDATAIVQGWVTTPTSNDGLEVKLADETSTGPQERSLFAGTNTAEPLLSPTLVVTYLDPTSANTYYAPTTPAKTVPGTTYTVPVTVNNTTGSTWAAANQKLTYHWTLPDGTDVTNSGNQLQTALPADMAPGSQQTVNAQVTPPTPTDSNAKGQYTLAWDMLNTSTGSYLSNGTGGIGSLNQAVGVEQNGSNQLGLESFYQYSHQSTGSGSSLYTNESSGNTVWSYNAFSNPSRGFATFVRLNYNSLDTTDTTTGFGWSVQASTPTRLGSPLDFHPKPNPTDVTFTDGDGTSHEFTWNSTTSTWTAPPGVHLYLQQLATCGPQVTNSRAWEMTKPDRTQFFYDCEGFPTAVVDKNGNEADFTYTSRKSENKPEEFLSYITDPTGRQTLTVNYFNKGDNYNYIDANGNLASGTNLTNPKIIDHVKSMTDISGREIDFLYTTNGLLARMVDGAGNPAAKTFNFAYDATQGMKNVKLVQATDPRGDNTKISYYDPSTDPKFHWWTQNVTDRSNHTTGFAYTEPGTVTNAAVQTTVTDPNGNKGVYQVDSAGRLLQATDALNHNTNLAWDNDNNVTSMTENNGAVSSWTYDQNTGYPLTHKDALANKNNTAAATYTYQTSLNGHVADITDKVSPAGRHWHFGYDANGNLTSVQQPNGTAAGSGYTSTLSYDTVGDLLTETDANNHTTTFSNYDPSGYPDSTKDAVGSTATVAYGPRGEVTSSTDPLGHVTTQNYDVFLRPLDGKTPKDQANGVYVTRPAPVYDTNDNVTQATAANGAVTTAVFDPMDRLLTSTLPPFTSTSGARTSTYTYDAAGNELTTTEPSGNVSGAAAGSYTVTFGYDALNRPFSATDSAGEKATVGYDDVGNVVNTTDPVKNAISGNTTKSTQTAYDLNHRAVTGTDAAGKTSSTGYDLDGLKVSTTDQNGNTTNFSYDQNGQLTQQQVPHTGSAPNISYDTTQYKYDQAGNRTTVISPRGVASGVANAFTTTTNYDADNRKIAVFGAYDPNDATYNKAPETDYAYDPAGRLAQVTAPPSGNQTVRGVTKMSYWDNGWARTSTDPWSILTSYDYNALGQQTARTIASAGGSSSRTQAWAYNPDGSLQSHSDNGVPVGLAVELVDNSDSQNVSSVGTWTSSSAGTGYNGYDYATHAAGAGTDSFTWNLNIPQDGNYQVYVQYPAVSGAATTAGYTVNYNGGSANQTVDQTKNAGTWVSLGSYAFTQAGTGQKITLAQNGGGAVTADAIKVVRDNSADTQPKPLSYAYSYDTNGNLVDVADSSPGAQYDDYAYSYDGQNRMTQLQEKLTGTVKHTTGFSYDANGKPTTQTHDGATATATYDVRNLLSSVVNKESSTDPNPKTTSYTYTPSMQIATETKGNNNVVTSAYNLDDSLASTVEKNTGGTTVAQHTYTYDPNGNQTQDVAVTQSADNGSTSLNRTATNTYTPRDQIASVSNSDGNNNQNYTYDLAGNITAQTVAGVVTTNVFDRNRQLSTTQNGLTGTFNYDPFGRVDTVTSGSTVQDRYTYDGFDRVTSQQTFNGVGMSTTNNVYDAFSRKVSQTTNAGTGNAKTTNFDFLATSNAIVGEEVNGTLSKTYQYSPWGERLDQIVHKSDGTEEPTYYSYDAHTNVQAITDTSGNAKSTYGYTAYGSDDTSQDTGVDKPGSQPAGTDPYNAYRFNADRVDTASGNYDMGFRNYSPGLNRFLSRDSYEGALADLNMTADPYTGNRYAFGGGNPLSNIELDGHEFVPTGGAPTPGTPAFFDWMQKTLDDYVDKKYAEGKAASGTGAPTTKGTYVMAYDPASDRAVINKARGSETTTNLYGNSCRNCAERVSATELGVPVNQPYYSDARMIKTFTQPVSPPKGPCTQCQVDMDPPQFRPNTNYEPGGRFDQLKLTPAAPKPSTGGTAAVVEEAGKGAGVLSKVSTAFKWGGRGLMVLGIAADVYDVATAPDSQKLPTAVKDTASLAGAWAGAEVGAEGGAAIGAAIGSVIPGLGTAAGGVVGGIIGGIGGAIVGGGIGDAIGNEISSWF